MSFQAPIQRKRSRFLLSWRTFFDPPQLSRLLSVVLCVVDIVFPGVGTMVAGVITDNMDTFLIGALQLMTSIVIIGWVWSISWGVELVRRSLRRGSNDGFVDTGDGASISPVA